LPEPPICEYGELLLAIQFTAIDSQAARIHAINQVLGEQPEVAGPQECAQFIPFVRLVQWIEDLESRIAGIGWNLPGKMQRMIVEPILHEPDRLHVCQRKFVNVNRLVITVTGMKKLDAKRQWFRGPQRILIAEGNLHVFVVIKLVLAKKIRKVH